MWWLWGWLMRNWMIVSVGLRFAGPSLEALSIHDERI